MKPAAARVQAALDAIYLGRTVLELPVEARTSQQAADAVGLGVGQIEKSLVRDASALRQVRSTISG